MLHAGRTLGYSHAVGGNKLFVLVRGGQRVTLELPRQTYRDAGFVFGPYPNGDVRLADTRRVVTFIACQRGENTDPHLDAWPVSAWVGGLLAHSPRCLPLLVWVDDEHAPRRSVIRFGVRSCG